MSWREQVERELAEDVYRTRLVDFAVGPVVDLGANVGLFAAHALRLGARRVICVEPHPAHFAELQGFARPRSNVDLVRAAVGPRGRGAMQGEDGSALLIAGDEVDVLPLELILPAGDVALLKMDVEGGEYDAVDGCPSAVLARCVRIAIETHAAAPGRLGALVEKLTETHHVETLGAASRGGYVYALRYGR